MDETRTAGSGAKVIQWPLPRRLVQPGADRDFDGVNRTGAERLEAVREYALAVLGDTTRVAQWLGETHAGILGGTAVVSEACQCLDGFRQAMLELFRLRSRRDSPKQR